MKRNFIILLLALVASFSVEAQVLTFDNPGDKLSPYKESLFNPANGDAYFDEIYISQNKSAYYMLYQNTRDNVIKNLRDMTASAGLWTYTDTLGNEQTITAYTGRNVRLMNGDSRWGSNEATKKKTYLQPTSNGPDHSAEALYYYEPTQDGMLVTDLKHTEGTFYYGYYKIYRTRNYTYRRDRTATVKRTETTTSQRETKTSGIGRWKITQYRYVSTYNFVYKCTTGSKRQLTSHSKTKTSSWSLVDVNPNVYTHSYDCSFQSGDFNYTTTRTAYSSSYRYEPIEVKGADNASSRFEAGQLPANSIDNTNTQQQFETWSNSLAWNSWTCEEDDGHLLNSNKCENSCNLNAVTTSWTIEQSCTKSYTLNDYFYVWARRVEDANGNARLDFIDADGNPVSVVLSITDTQANKAISNPETALMQTNLTGEFKRDINEDTRETVGQVRHIYTVFSKRGVNVGLLGNAENFDFYDYTWYDLSYSPNGQKYTTVYMPGTNTNPPASYHQWDKQFWEGGATGTGSGYAIRLPDTETALEKTASGAAVGETDKAYKFVKSTDKGYVAQELFDFKNVRLGTKTNKKIYFTGNFDQLKQDVFTSNAGWAQLQNCDIYLEDAFMQSANSTVTDRTYVVTHWLENGTKNYATWDFLYTTPAFLVPSGESRFHLNGSNELLGSEGGTAGIKLKMRTNNTMYKKFDTDGAPIDSTILYYKRYSSPIEIKDGATANVVIDAFWPENRNMYGSLDIAGCGNKVAPLYTGGENGTYTINGGYINIVPANYHANATKMTYKKNFVKPIGKIGEWLDKRDMLIYINYTTYYAEWSNYLVCGSSYQNSSLYGNKWNFTEGSGNGTNVYKNMTFLRWLEGAISLFTGEDINNVDYVKNTLEATDSIGLSIKGLGGGVPLGQLIINGGTITMVGSDENQPLLAPNVQINGGNIVNPIYTATVSDATANSYKNGYNLAVPINKRKDAVNKYGESLQRWEYKFPDKATDYSEWHIDSVWAKPENEYPQALCIFKADNKNSAISILSSGNKDNYYYYGMTNVLSGDDKYGYLYVTQDDHTPHWEWHKNYVISPGETVSGLGGDGVDNLYRPVYFTFYHGGAFNEYDDFTVIAKARHKRKYMDNAYYPICMPYKVNKIWDTDDGESVQLTSFVSPTVNPDADNSMAYCYLYFLDEDRTDDIIDNTTHGVEEVFQTGYTTHADGRYILANQPYIFKMINNSGKPYWTFHYVVLESETGATINGANHFVSAPRPTIGPKDVETPDELPFVMGGNPSFAYKEFGEPFFRVQPEWNGDSNWWKEQEGSFQPCESFLLGSLETTKIMRTLSRDAFYEAKQQQEVATEIENTNNNFSVISGKGQITIISSQVAQIQIYTPTGKLVTSTQLDASVYKTITLPQGVYLVRNEQDIEKVLVK
ncbi:MAG: T9SS type A sorting domain-containing protein [Paludibacteraceae bacterium]|nr:T9SS type A sorting domain-containing protein [Paludibacteraceae bacterium]